MLCGGHLDGVGSSAATNVAAKLVLVTWALCPLCTVGGTSSTAASCHNCKHCTRGVHPPSLQLPRPTMPSHQSQF